MENLQNRNKNSSMYHSPSQIIVPQSGKPFKPYNSDHFVINEKNEQQEMQFTKEDSLKDNNTSTKNMNYRENNHQFDIEDSLGKMRNKMNSEAYNVLTGAKEVVSSRFLNKLEKDYSTNKKKIDLQVLLHLAKKMNLPESEKMIKSASTIQSIQNKPILKTLQDENNNLRVANERFVDENSKLKSQLEKIITEGQNKQVRNSDTLVNQAILDIVEKNDISSDAYTDSLKNLEILQQYILELKATEDTQKKEITSLSESLKLLMIKSESSNSNTKSARKTVAEFENKLKLQNKLIEDIKNKIREASRGKFELNSDAPKDEFDDNLLSISEGINAITELHRLSLEGTGKENDFDYDRPPNLSDMVENVVERLIEREEHLKKKEDKAEECHQELVAMQKQLLRQAQEEDDQISEEIEGMPNHAAFNAANNRDAHESTEIDYTEDKRALEEEKKEFIDAQNNAFEELQKERKELDDLREYLEEERNNLGQKEEELHSKSEQIEKNLNQLNQDYTRLKDEKLENEKYSFALKEKEKHLDEELENLKIAKSKIELGEAELSHKLGELKHKINNYEDKLKVPEGNEGDKIKFLQDSLKTKDNQIELLRKTKESYEIRSLEKDQQIEDLVNRLDSTSEKLTKSMNQLEKTREELSKLEYKTKDLEMEKEQYILNKTDHSEAFKTEETKLLNIVNSCDNKKSVNAAKRSQKEEQEFDNMVESLRNRISEQEEIIQDLEKQIEDRDQNNNDDRNRNTENNDSKQSLTNEEKDRLIGELEEENEKLREEMDNLLVDNETMAQVLEKLNEKIMVGEIQMNDGSYEDNNQKYDGEEEGLNENEGDIEGYDYNRDSQNNNSQIEHDVENEGQQEDEFDRNEEQFVEEMYGDNEMEDLDGSMELPEVVKAVSDELQKLKKQYDDLRLIEDENETLIADLKVKIEILEKENFYLRKKNPGQNFDLNKLDEQNNQENQFNDKSHEELVRENEELVEILKTAAEEIKVLRVKYAEVVGDLNYKMKNTTSNEYNNDDFINAAEEIQQSSDGRELEELKEFNRGLWESVEHYKFEKNELENRIVKLVEWCNNQGIGQPPSTMREREEGDEEEEGGEGNMNYGEQRVDSEDDNQQLSNDEELTIENLIELLLMTLQLGEKVREMAIKDDKTERERLEAIVSMIDNFELFNEKGKVDVNNIHKLLANSRNRDSDKREFAENNEEEGDNEGNDEQYIGKENFEDEGNEEQGFDENNYKENFEKVCLLLEDKESQIAYLQDELENAVKRLEIYMESEDSPEGDIRSMNIEIIELSNKIEEAKEEIENLQKELEDAHQDLKLKDHIINDLKKNFNLLISSDKPEKSKKTSSGGSNSFEAKKKELGKELIRLMKENEELRSNIVQIQRNSEEKENELTGEINKLVTQQNSSIQERDSNGHGNN